MGCAAPWWTRTAQDGAGQGWAGWLAGCWLAGWCSGSGGGSGGGGDGGGGGGSAWLTKEGHGVSD